MKKNHLFKTNTIAALLIAASVASSVTVFADDGISLVEGIGHVNQESIDVANSLLNKVPSALLEEFVSNGWKFYISGDDVAQKYPDSNDADKKGYISFDDKSIEVEHTSDSVKATTVHEFGHYVDYIKGGLSDTDEFKKIFDNECDSFCERFDIDELGSAAELFADGFYRCYNDEDSQLSLKEVCPELYEFIISSQELPDA